MLSPGLRTGEIDLFVGYLSEIRARQGLVQEQLYLNSAAIVARHGHPLHREGKRLALANLVHKQWILPLPDTVLRRHIDAAFRSAGHDPPATAVQSVTMLLIQSLLMNSDMIAVLPRQIAIHLKQLGLVSIVPIKVGEVSLRSG